LIIDFKNPPIIINSKKNCIFVANPFDKNYNLIIFRMSFFKRVIPFLFILSLFLSSCNQKKIAGIAKDENVAFLLHEWNQTITDIMVGDGFSPLLASRTYAYPNIAAYEMLIQKFKDKQDMKNRLNGLHELPPVEIGKIYCFELAAIQTFATVAKKLVYREEPCDVLLKKHIAFFRDSMNLHEDVINNSLEYGKLSGEQIIAWAKEDKYAETKGKPKYLFSTEPGKWSPTPSEFRSALEPFWGTVRTFSGINPSENAVPFSIPFSTEKGSRFYNLAKEVYDSSKTLTDYQKTIALYWDDNPDQMTFQGHIPNPRRRISPVAHWLGITQQACKSKGLDMMESSKCYTMVSIAIADAIICCWKQKYETNLIRPVTYIHDHIDPEWSPMIETPPFPEHTSGHASVSFSSATVLTHIIGNSEHFTDIALKDYGLNERSFNNFYEAANEAAISRFYGGIHYKTGVDGGIEQGKKTGQFVIRLFENKN